MRLRIVFRGRLAELRVEEECQQGHRDNVRGDGLFVIFGHSELLRPQAGVGDEHVDAWQFRLDSFGKKLGQKCTSSCRGATPGGCQMSTGSLFECLLLQPLPCRHSDKQE